MHKKLFVTFFLSFIILSFVSAIDISGCQDINSDYFDTTLTLTQDINNWSGTCFNLTSSGDSNFILLDCSNHQIDFNQSNVTFFSTNSLNIDSLTFVNCDINQGINSSTNYVLNLNANVNMITISDSNLSVQYSSLVNLSNYSDDNLYFDFSGSIATLLGSSTGFYLNDSDFNTFTIANLSLTSSGSYLIRNYANDLNYLNIFDSNLTLNSGIFFYTQTLSDSELNVDFLGSNITLYSGYGLLYSNSANYNLINYSNLNIYGTSSSNYFRINSDINYFNLLNSNIDINSGNLVYLEATDSTLDLNFSGTDINFFGSITSSINVAGKYSNLNIYNMSSVSQNIYVASNGDLNYLNVFNCIWSGTFLNDQSTANNFIDINLKDSNFTLSSSYFLNMSNELDVSIFDLNLYSTSTTTEGLFSGKFNHFDLIDSYVYFSEGYLLYKTTQYNTFDFNLTGTTITTNINQVDGFTYFGPMNINTINIDGLPTISNTSGGTLFYLYNRYVDVDINNINISNSSFYAINVLKPYSSKADNCMYFDISDSNLVFGVSSYYAINNSCSNYVIKISGNSDFNVYDIDSLNVSEGSLIKLDSANISNIDTFGANSWNSSFGSFLDMNDSNIISLSLEYITATIDNNFIVMNNNSNVDTLTLYKDILTTDSLISICNDCNVKSGSIYTNKFVDTNRNNPFVYAPINVFNVDLNQPLTACDPLFCQRYQILPDGAAFDGGNLWKENTTTICDGDPTHDGICDYPVEVYGSDENYYDYLPMVDAYVAYTCKSITSDYLDNTLYVMDNLANWSGNCFSLGASGTNKYLVVDCDGRSITAGGSSDNLFRSLSYDLNSITFKDCNLELLTSDNLINMENRNLNYLFLEDSNILGGNVFYHGSTADTFLDFNFFNSLIINSSIYNSLADVNYLEISDLNLSYTNLSASSGLFDSYNTNYFYLINSYLDINSSDEIFDLSGLNGSQTMTFTDTNIILRGETSGFYSGAYATTIYDLNVLGLGSGTLFSNSIINIFDSNIDLNSGNLFYDYGASMIDLNFNNLTVILNGSSNAFIIDDNDPVYIYDLNLDFNSSGNVIDNRFDTNVHLLNLNIDQYNGKLLNISHSEDYSNYTSFDLNFYSSNVNLFDNAVGIRQAYDLSGFNISNLNLTDSTSNDFYYGINVDLTNINFVDSNIRKSDGNFFIFDYVFQPIDLNFYNSDINLEGTNIDFYAFFDNSFYPDGIDFNLTTNKLSAGNNLFYIYAGEGILNISDSNIILDNLINVGYLAHINSGFIANNIFYDLNQDNNFGFIDHSGVTYGTFDVDFNKSLNLNDNVNRSMIISDDSNITGGNLWLDSNGNNLCSIDLESPLGICDNNFRIGVTNGSYFYDYLPIVEYIQLFDLTADNIDVNDSTIVYGESIDFNFNYSNIGNANISDYNLFFYIDDVLISYITRTESIDLLDSNYNNFIWDVNQYGDLNFMFCTNYLTDENTVNDCNSFIQHVYYRDIYPIRIEDPNTFILGGIYNTNNQLRLYVNNLGDYNSEDVNINLYLWDDTNELNITSYSWQTQDIIPFFTLDFNYNPNFIGYLDYNIILTPSQTDYNSLNNEITKIQQFSVYYFDFNSNIQIPDVNAGHSIDVNCLTYDLGGAFDNGYDSDINVLFYVDDVFEDNYSGTIQNKTVFSWTPNARGDYNLGCVVESLDYNDYNTLNNSYYTIKSVGSDTNVDLKPTDINLSSVGPGAKTITCDINNIGDINTNNDYNVKLYVNDVLLGFNDLNTQIDVNSKSSTTFAWTSAIGSYVLRCEVDYNVNNYSGYDANILNNSYSENVNIACVSNCGGGGTTDTPYNVKLSSASATGNISKTSSTILNASITKSGTEIVPNFDLIVYILENGIKKQIDSKTLSNSDLPYDSYSKTISLNDLLVINSDLNQLVDTSGKITFYFELNVSGDELETDNNKSSKVTLNYADSEIKNIKLKQGSKLIDISSKIDFDVTKKYELVFNIDYESINKFGIISVTGKNKSQNKVFYNKPYGFGGPSGKSINNFDISIPITILNLMSESNAKQVIASAIGGILGDYNTDNKVNEIIASLGNISTINPILTNNVIYLSGLSDELELSITGDDDLLNNNYNFDFEYFSSDTLDLNVPDDNNVVIDINKGPGGNEGGAGDKDISLDTKGDVISKDEIYILKYKSKLGLDENQEIFVYNKYNEPRLNLSLKIDSQNNSWFLQTDSYGKATFVIQNDGVYTIYVPYPETQVTGIFEVISGYNSSSSDFVELSSMGKSGSSNNTTKLRLEIIFGIVVILLIGLGIYYLAKPKNKFDVYDFTKTTNYKQSNYFTSLLKGEYIKEVKKASHDNQLLEKKFKKRTGYDL